MKLTGNTILITGGGSGIGLGLAEEFKKLGNEVIVAGRTESKLETARSKGLKTLMVDMTDEKSIQELASEAISQFPSLNIVIQNAGVMINEKVISGDTSKIAADTITTNLLGPIRLTNALLPHLLKQDAAVIMTVTSGLAYVPFAMTPSYSATKAAIHSYTQALRYQLKDTSVEVKELVPPYVRTGLMGDRQKRDQNAMPLEEFVTEVISILREQPRIDEIIVKRVNPQRTSSYEGAEKYADFFKKQNDMLFSVRQKEWDEVPTSS